MKIIEVNKVNKKYKKVIHDDLFWNINKGESVALVGRNGAGKTVLSEMIAGIQKQDSGEIKINTQNGVYDVAILFQNINLPSSFTLKEIIKFYSMQYSDRITKEEVDQLLEIFELKDYLKTKFKKLSGGTKQKVNLLTTLMKKSEIIILDEFVTGLDVISVEKILQHLNKIRKENKLTYIVISHQPEELRRLSDKICVLEDGKISNEYKTSDIEKKYKADFAKFLREVLHE